VILLRAIAPDITTLKSLRHTNCLTTVRVVVELLVYNNQMKKIFELIKFENRRRNVISYVTSDVTRSFRLDFYLSMPNESRLGCLNVVNFVFVVASSV